MLDLTTHPCFNDKARHTHGRVHLPVAPACNVSCKFCDRKYDCVSESRPGVTSQVLTPPQALTYLEEVIKATGNISVVGIAGPGDPFANPVETMETLRLVRAAHPELLLCVSSNGLGIGPYLDELAQLGTSHVTITVNGVDPETVMGVYNWIRPGRRTMPPRDAAQLLIDAQAEAIKGLKARGVTVKVNTVLVPGVNEGQIERIAARVKELGADIMNVIPYCKAEGSSFGKDGVAEPDGKLLKSARDEAGKHLPLMHHCKRCRADAAGLLGDEPDFALLAKVKQAGAAQPSTERPYVAVVTTDGMHVDGHLGKAVKILVYGAEGGQGRMAGVRIAPEPGGGEERWRKLGVLLGDCFAVLAHDAGENPVKILAETGLEVRKQPADTYVEDVVADALGLQKKKK